MNICSDNWNFLGININPTPMSFNIRLTSNLDVTLPTESGYTYDASIDWGDGTVTYISSWNDIGRNHTYANAGIYLIQISGTFQSFSTVNYPEFGQILTQFNSYGVTPLYRLSFKDCYQLTSIPAPTSVLSNITDFSYLLANTSVTDIPSNLFSFSTGATNFSHLLEDTKVTTIPSDLFSYCPNATDFSYILANTSLTDIPSDLFSYSTGATNFEYAFYNLTGVTSIPSTLFSGITNGSNFTNTFGNLVNVTGSVPTLWEIYSTATGTSCFSGLIMSTNYDDIPAEWGGSTDFMFEVVTLTNNKTLKLPTQNGYNYNYTVDYGDGTINHVTTYNGTGATHIYASAGTYKVVITGQIPCFNTGGIIDKYLITKIVHFGTNVFKRFYLDACYNLTSIAEYGLRMTADESPSFRNCTSLQSIPENLFSLLNNITYFGNVFSGCTSLTSIPSNLFKYNTSCTNFEGAFSYCTSLTSVPADLFRYNILACYFKETFKNCTSLTSIPTDFFRYCNPQTENMCFKSTFENCTSLTTIPDYLFRYCNRTMYLDFNKCFKDCDSLTINPLTFYANGEQNTRFYNNHLYLDFIGCFSRYAYNGTVQVTVQGTAPDLWNCRYTYVLTDNCFVGDANNSTTLSNYSSIPSDWK